MLIATALAVALTVNVSVAPEVSATLVSRVLAETDDIWRSSGLTFAWQRAPREAAAATLHVVIGHDVRPARNGGLAIGWIVFEDSKPEQEIYLSYSNARQLMVESPGVVGVVDRMPIMEREMLLARALGRALAHEIGHYVLASKAHTLTGLMRSRVTATEFFGPDNRTFALDNGQQSSITAWLGREGIVASR
jgi:hypothetical protein